MFKSGLWTIKLSNPINKYLKKPYLKVLGIMLAMK